jgi:hypothetical protein
MNQHCHFFDFAFSSDRLWPTTTLIILQTVSPLRKTLVPLKHGTAAQSFFAEQLLHDIKRFARGFA